LVAESDYIRTMRTVSIVGIGRAGGALAIALARKGYTVENLVSRDPQKISRIAELTGSNVLPAGEYAGLTSETILITTQDARIAGVATGLAAALKHKPCVFHTSGALSSEILDDLAKTGCLTGSIHPLVSISDPERGATRFGGTWFCVEGMPGAVETAKEIVADLGGKPFTIETRLKTLYHASALIAAGHLTALLDISFEIMSKCGMSTDEAREILLPLVRSTVDNLEVQSPETALTGTFARADAETFERHLESFEGNVSEEIREIYLQLALRSLHLAEKNGVERARVEALREKVLMAKRDVR
jgi:predicted short-subunit dehydrogenase-like oxidoreductase (DUF2520 family)